MPISQFVKFDPALLSQTITMTRGRKKDHTIPESRALASQRSYRDRKAKYVAELEERCSAAEAEVIRLREELAEARRMQGSASILDTSEARQLVRRSSRYYI